MNENKKEIEVKEELFLRIVVESVTVPSDTDVKKGIKTILSYTVSTPKNGLMQTDVKNIKCEFAVNEKEILNKKILVKVQQIIIPQNFDRPKVFYKAQSYEVVK